MEHEADTHTMHNPPTYIQNACLLPEPHSQKYDTFVIRLIILVDCGFVIFSEGLWCKCNVIASRPTYT